MAEVSVAQLERHSHRRRSPSSLDPAHRLDAAAGQVQSKAGGGRSAASGSSDLLLPPQPGPSGQAASIVALDREAGDPQIYAIPALESAQLRSRTWPIESRGEGVNAEAGGTQSSIEVNPSRIAYLVISARLCTPSFFMMFRRWLSTVLVEMCSFRAIWGDVWPSARSCTISRSRGPRVGDPEDSGWDGGRRWSRSPPP